MNDAWTVLPFEGLAGVVPEGIGLGGRRSEIAGRLATAFGRGLGERQLFRKAPWATGLCEQYADGGLILFFDDVDRLVYLELYEPAPVSYAGVALLGRDTGAVIADLAAAGCRLVEGEEGYDVPDAGFNLTGEPGLPVESVGIYAKNPAESLLGMSGEEPVEAISEHHLVSGKGTRIVQLGQDRLRLRSVLGPAQQSRPDYGGENQDWYFDHGLILGFDGDDRLISLAISYVGRTGTAWFNGVQLLDRPYDEVVADLGAQGVRVEREALGGRAPEHGFALHLIGLRNPAMPVVAVSFTAENESGHDQS
ncbi:hypothetical protein [Actinomadura rugatobispora]|uniref:Uncharacterized protein n=1 Tax=Actinomadura rugatobispora TaxID=1994 RepID=A0ABW1A3G9_9ACTN|nr:hypothetical protein GCM10010200_011100 [Actinomadura rugatobispora]